MNPQNEEEARRAQAAQFPRPPRDVRPKILDERLTELENTVRQLEAATCDVSALSPQDARVLHLAAHGFTNKEIAAEIRRSLAVVGFAKRRLHLKFQTGGSVVKLLQRAAAAGLIPPPERTEASYEAIGRAITRLFKSPDHSIELSYDGMVYEVYATVSKTSYQADAIER